MNNNDLMKAANEQTKNRTTSRNSGYDVMVSVSAKEKHNNVRVTITIYREPRRSHYTNSEYWQPVYFPELNRVYMLYADKRTGYKVVKNTKSAIGHIKFAMPAMSEFLLTQPDKLPRFENWLWDSECAKPYIQLD